MAQKKWSEIQSYDDLGYYKRRFADWLATPEPFRDIKTQSELAEELGISRETLSKWKYKDVFIKIVQKRKRDIAGVDGLNKVLDALLVRAGKVKDNVREANDAAELFLNWFYNKDFTKGGEFTAIQGQSNGPSYEEQAENIRGILEGQDREMPESDE